MSENFNGGNRRIGGRQNRGGGGFRKVFGGRRGQRGSFGREGGGADGNERTSVDNERRNFSGAGCGDNRSNWHQENGASGYHHRDMKRTEHRSPGHSFFRDPSPENNGFAKFKDPKVRQNQQQENQYNKNHYYRFPAEHNNFNRKYIPNELEDYRQEPPQQSLSQQHSLPQQQTLNQLQQVNTPLSLPTVATAPQTNVASTINSATQLPALNVDVIPTKAEKLVKQRPPSSSSSSSSSEDDDKTPAPTTKLVKPAVNLPAKADVPLIVVKQEKHKQETKTKPQQSSSSSSDSSSDDETPVPAKIVQQQSLESKSLKTSKPQEKETELRKKVLVKTQKASSSSSSSSEEDDSSSSEEDEVQKPSAKVSKASPVVAAKHTTKDAKTAKEDKVENEPDVVCLGKLKKKFIVEDSEDEMEKEENHEVNANDRTASNQKETFSTTGDACGICEKSGHNSFQCQMVCKNCGAPYHNLKSCPKPANLIVMMQHFMEFCMQQMNHFNPEQRFSFLQSTNPHVAGVSASDYINTTPVRATESPAVSSVTTNNKRKRKIITKSKEAIKKAGKKKRKNIKNESSHDEEDEDETTTTADSNTSDSESESDSSKEIDTKQKKKRTKKVSVKESNYASPYALNPSVSPFTALPHFGAAAAAGYNPLLLGQIFNGGFASQFKS